MKRIHGMPGTPLEPPGIQGIPWARPWDPGDALGPPGTPLGPPEDVHGTPRDAPTTPRDTYGPQQKFISQQVSSARSS